MTILYIELKYYVSRNHLKSLYYKSFVQSKFLVSWITMCLIMCTVFWAYALDPLVSNTMEVKTRRE